MENITVETKREYFNLTFQISKMVIFQVEYYILGSNKSPHFSTSAGVFIKSKRDFIQCGQCQKDVLFGKALKFFYKWDKLHLKDLTDIEYTELIKDIEELKNNYNWIDNVRFYNQVELSKLNLKKLK